MCGNHSGAVCGKKYEMWSFEQVHTFNNIEHKNCNLILKDLDGDQRFDIIFCDDCKMVIGQLHYNVCGHKANPEGIGI